MYLTFLEVNRAIFSFYAQQHTVSAKHVGPITYSNSVRPSVCCVLVLYPDK